MPTEIIFTALPNGRTGDRLHLSVHVAFRLTEGEPTGTLADYSAVVAWPPGDLAFDIELQGGPTYAATVISSPDPSLWSKVFPSTSPVQSYQFVDKADIPIHTYPLGKVMDFLQANYTDIALNSPSELPAVASLLAGSWTDLHAALDPDEVRTVLDDPTKRVVDTTQPSSTTFDFAQLVDFFAPADLSDPDVEAEFLEPVELPELDFHSAVQFCNQHPPLMRLLGLTFDVDVDVSEDPPPSGPTTVKVVPSAAILASHGVIIRSPETVSAVSPADFVALPGAAAPHLNGGFLRFDDANQFIVGQVDCDGGGIKAVDFARNLHNKDAHKTVDTPTDTGLPTLRSDGFSVARKGHAKHLHDRLKQAAAGEASLAADALQLHAEDLVRGYRIDVWDSESSEWRSLMWRSGSYEFSDSTTIPVTDEGVLTTSAGRKQGELYLSEEVFWWDGWSLVAPRPGQTLNIDPLGDPLVDRPPNLPGPDFPVRLHFDVTPGTLPSLRMGTEYRFRARLVDLAGNSLSPDSTDDSHATTPRRFGRYQPPQTPPVLLRTPSGPGESVETVAVRSNFDTPASEVAERHLVPAQVGQLTVEHHGVLDVTGALDKSAYTDLATRDANNLQNHPDADGPEEGPRFYDVDHLSINYLADPAVGDLAIKLLDPPFDDTPRVYPFLTGVAWPDLASIRLVVREGTGGPDYDPDTRVLTIALAKGTVARARLSSALQPTELDDFGIWHWILDSAPSPTERAALEALAEKGQHWMLEPFRILTLVNAVRQPLLTPEMSEGLAPHRDPSATWALLTGPLAFSRTSTSRVDVLASWEDPVDDGPGAADPADVGEDGSRLVVDQPAIALTIDNDPPIPDEEPIDHRHEIGDTKHHLVTYRAVATTRFGEFFTETLEFSMGRPEEMVLVSSGGTIPGSVKVTHDDTDRILVEGEHYTVDSDNGYLTFLEPPAPPAFAPAEGDALTAHYLAPPITRESSQPIEINIPSSARPAAPKVLYAVPTFGWESGVIDEPGIDGLTSTRRGNGLRVYLERPWWSSGQGELLGVVTWPPGEQRDPPDLEDVVGESDPRRPFVTQWGEDPIFGSDPLAGRYPRLGSFPEAVATAEDLTLAELDSSSTHPVNVAGHTVAFDTDRKLWYCDIAALPGAAYTPFIRLALARYQPNSIGNKHLSSTVLADFVQLAPDRFATVVFDDAEDTILGVTLSGPTHRSTELSGGGPHPGTAHIILEQRVAGLDDDLGWQAVGDPIEMAESITGAEGEWFAEVHLPGPRTPNTWRLVIEQFELLSNEREEQTAIIPLLPTAGARPVHRDIIEI